MGRGSVYCDRPHLHMSLVDYTDGSSYDIWALLSDRLAIIPQIFASKRSMSRLVNHIFEKIGGGRLERYDKKAARRLGRPDGDRRAGAPGARAAPAPERAAAGATRS